MKSIKAIVGGAVLATGLTLGFAPAPAQAQSLNDIVRVIVGINDIVYRGGVPYYRYGDYGPQDRIVVVRENGRNQYYRNVYRNDRYYRNAPRGNAYGYYGQVPRGNANAYYRNASKYRYYNDRDRRWNDNRRWDRDDDDDQGRRSHRRDRDD